MRIRPVHIWWLGVALFAPSVLIWAFVLSTSICYGRFNCPFDWQGIKHIYLPLFAALVGFTVPVVCLRSLRSASWRLNSWAFAGYLIIMLTWGVIDIQHKNHQLCGWNFDEGRRIHHYYTWAFIPPDWIALLEYSK